ncbi:MAG: CPBP family intramembrane metalloprotease [Phycisphaerales bacterium]|nr:MAG: CPBP family intramembrane metalloprotease [Phycisphaerales bacterium]
MSEPNGSPWIVEADAASPAECVARPVSWESLHALPPDPMLLQAVSRADALVDIGVLVAAAVLTLSVETGIYFLVAGNAGFPNLSTGGDNAPDPELVRAVILPAMATRTVLLTAAVFIINRARGLSLAALGVASRQLASNAGLGVLVIAALSLLMLAGAVVVQLVFPGFAEQMQENTRRLKEMVPRMSPPALLALMAMVAWWEELVFRGFLLTRVRRATGSWAWAVVVSGGVFVGLHALEQTGAAMLFISLLALTFSLLTIWRRSLIPAIAGHLVFDVSQFILLYYVHFPASQAV